MTPEIKDGTTSKIDGPRNYYEIEPPRSKLSPRETEILHLLSKDLTNKQIATRLDISDSTVKNHVTKILAVLDAQDHTQAVLKAINRGILNLDDLKSDFNLSLYDYITDREKEILADLANHQNTPGNIAIANRLNISTKTVNVHMLNISEKTGLSSRTQKALFYLAYVKAGKVTESSTDQPASA